MTDAASGTAEAGVCKRERSARLIGYGWHTVRIVAACALADTIAEGIALRESYWAVITAAVVTQPLLGDTLAASRNRVIGTLIGAGAGFAVLLAAQYGVPTIPMFWAMLIPMALLTAISPSLRLSSVTLIVVAIIPSDSGPFARPFDRVLGILVGALASVIVASAMHWWTEKGDRTPSA